MGQPTSRRSSEAEAAVDVSWKHGERVLCDRGTPTMTLLFAGLDSWPVPSTGCFLVRRDSISGAVSCVMKQLSGTQLGGGVRASWEIDVQQDLLVFDTNTKLASGVFPMVGWRFHGLRFAPEAARRFMHRGCIRTLASGATENIALKLWGLRVLQHASPMPMISAERIRRDHRTLLGVSGAVLAQIPIAIHPITGHVTVPVTHSQDIEVLRPTPSTISTASWYQFVRRVAVTEMRAINATLFATSPPAVPPQPLLPGLLQRLRRRRRKRLPAQPHPHTAVIEHAVISHFDTLSQHCFAPRGMAVCAAPSSVQPGLLLLFLLHTSAMPPSLTDLI